MMSEKTVAFSEDVINGEWIRHLAGWIHVSSYINRVCNQKSTSASIPIQSHPTGNDEENEPNKIVKYRDHACYIFFPRGGAKETGFYFTIGEVLNRLDFSSAVRDPKRFNYVCRILEIISENWLSSLSGLAQKNFFHNVEESVVVVTESKLFVNRLKKILHVLSRELQNSHMFHVGSPKTWNKWLEMVNDWIDQLNSIDYKPAESESEAITLTDLPVDCINHIMSYLTNAEDIVNLGATCKYLHTTSEYSLRWERLCRFNFTETQIKSVSHKFCNTDNELNWKGLYARLYHRHGTRELYNNVLNMCNHCNCIFWKDGGHPCSAEVSPEFMKRQFSDVVVTHQNLTPEEFMKLLPTP
ncbi:F-box only protein 32-like [Anneissia japonica]|uniref:F-box only protein 32-like n=1 Tax=Anneissia japonica TaxID=1529436 RepID=UPI0014258532|nr:F-box only protein 32-like [Anneissia japonica]